MQFTGTWTLNKEQTKVSASLTNATANKQQSAEWDLIGVTENELKLNMGNNTIIAFMRPPIVPVEPTGLLKTCGLDFFNKLVKGVRNKDMDAIKNAANYSLSITGYTESKKDTNRWGEAYTEYRSNEKFGMMEVPFKISKYENGEVSVTRNMKQEEINFTRNQLKTAEAAKQGWKYKGNDGLWDYWENGDVIFWFSGREVGSGSDTHIYTKKQVRMD